MRRWERVPRKMWQLPGAKGRAGEVWEAVNNAQDVPEGYFCPSQCKEELECPAQNKPRLGSWGPQINLLAGVTWGQGEFMEGRNLGGIAG